MGKLAPEQRIASAAVVWFGARGTVSFFARQRGISRQQVYRESDGVVEAVEGSTHRQQLQEYEQRVQELQIGLAEREQRLAGSIVADADKQAEFTCAAEAEGVSLPVARRLLRVLLGDKTPSVAQLGRWSKAAGAQASALLQVLDEHSHAFVENAAADEIYVGRKPILMVVEQESMCWQSGRLADHADGATWAEEFRTYPALAQVSRDAGSGLQKGLETVNAERQQQQAAIADQLDHFHTLREGSRALRVTQLRAQRALTKAEEAQTEVERRQRQGQSVAGYVNNANRCWRRAEECLDDWSSQEQAWQQVQEAMRLFTPTGKLNSRASAAAKLSEILPVLRGTEWAKTKRLLQRPTTLTYLDRVQEKLTGLPVAAELRAAAIRTEGLRRHPELLNKESTQAAALRGLALALGLLLAKAGEAGQTAVAQVRAVLRQTWRASSLVEGLNSVVRMQQARHRRMTQGLLDLKRLYWNCRVFTSGKRKGKSPYQHLGARLPDLRWWQLLKLTPEQLRNKLSAPP